jgi:hypothetical protein
MIKIKSFKENKYIYLLLIVSIGYFAIQVFLSQDLAMNPDEGTHATTGLFYKDLISNLKSLHSMNDIEKFTINYIVKYSKVTLYYPPLYHLLLAIVFSIQENIMIARILNILITIVTSFVIYRLAYECFGDKKISFLSSVFFLSFSIIFFYANKVMIDVLQILTFSLALWYYFKLKKNKIENLHLNNLLILSVLISVSFLTKFYSIFIPIIILLDSFLYSKKFFKRVLLCLILSFLIISPYAYLYYKFGMFKLVIGKAVTPWESSLVFFDIFRNFGEFLGFFVVFSLVYFFYRNRRSYIFFIWFFIPLAVLLYLKNSDPRFAFILMPIYAMSCAFSFTEVEKMLKTRLKKNLLVILISLLLLLQIISNIYLNSQGPNYPVDEIMKSVKKDGNVLILSEDPVYSSVFMFYGRTNKISGNVIRSCVFFKNNLTSDFLHDWGIRYVIDQENILNETSTKSLNLSVNIERKVNGTSLILYEAQGEVNKIECNFVCILLGKVCENASFSEIIPLINKNIYTMKD